jgi:hypothetical protein
MNVIAATERTSLLHDKSGDEKIKKKGGFTAASALIWSIMALVAAVAASVIEGTLGGGFGALPLTLGLSLLTLLPFLLSFAAAMKIRRSAEDDSYELVIPDSVDVESSAAAKESWRYERRRYLDASVRSQLYALMFGLTGSLTLSTCLVLAALSVRAGSVLANAVVRASILSLSAATATVFSIQFARCIQRIATRDDTPAMFSWATRAVIFVIIADLGFFALLYKATGGGSGLGLWGAALLGVTTGILGRNALRDLQAKAMEQLKLGTPKRKNDESILRVDGVTEEDDERCAEEGLRSLADLAFAPTARLFFNTGYSLQKITDWQDQALLALRVSDDRRAELAKLGARGATDLWELAKHFDIEQRFPALAAQAQSPKPAESDTGRNLSGAEPGDAWSALKLVLGLSEGALISLLWSVYTDDVVKRMRAYTKSVVKMPLER